MQCNPANIPDSHCSCVVPIRGMLVKTNVAVREKRSANVNLLIDGLRDVSICCTGVIIISQSGVIWLNRVCFTNGLWDASTNSLRVFTAIWYSVMALQPGESSRLATERTASLAYSLPGSHYVIADTHACIIIGICSNEHSIQVHCLKCGVRLIPHLSIECGGYYISWPQRGASYRVFMYTLWVLEVRITVRVGVILPHQCCSYTPSVQ